MLVRIGRRDVDVLDRDCKDRECFRLGFDKGAYTPGRGYTSYHRDARGRRVEKAVCMRRMLHGCPTNSVCPECRLASVREPGSPCEGYLAGGCHGVTVAS